MSFEHDNLNLAVGVHLPLPWLPQIGMGLSWLVWDLALSDRSEQTYRTDRKVCIELLKNVVK